MLVTPSERLADEVEAEFSTRQVSVTRHVDRIRTSLSGPAVRHRARRDLEQGLAVVDAYAAEHLEIPPDAAAWAAGAQRRRDLHWVPYAPVSLGDYCAGSNHVLPTGGCACHSSGPPCVRSPSPCTSSTTRAALGGRRPRRDARRGRGPAGSRRDPCACASRLTTTRATAPRGAAGDRALRRAQLDVPVQLNVNENPDGPSPACAADIAAAVAQAAVTLNRYPDRELRRPADGAGVVPRSRRHPRPGVGGQRVQRGDAAAAGLRRSGPVALSFAPTYSMYPEYARDTVTEWVVGHRESDFALDLDHAHDLVKERQPSVVLP